MMLYFVMARHKDARPIIDYYDLKKDMAPCPFTVFTANDVVLCISDEGKANAAAATAYLLSRWGKDGLFVHLGIISKEQNMVLYPFSITDNREIAYQEMLYNTPHYFYEDSLNDGEGLYAFMAAARFLPLKQIIVLRAHNTINEGTFSWLETIFGTMLFPIFMWKSKQKTIL